MYKLTNTDFVLRISDGTLIPMDSTLPGYQEYLAWTAAGNTPEPAQTPAEVVAATQLKLKTAAQAALGSTDVVALRCWKANVPYPADWQAYTTSLRSIVSGTDTTSTSLPIRPAYPAGT